MSKRLLCIALVFTSMSAASSYGADDQSLRLATLRPRALTADVHSPLSPMMIAIKDSGGVLKGTDSKGSPVISLPASNIEKLKASAAVRDVTTTIPENIQRVTRLKLSYKDDRIPTDADLEAIGLKRIGKPYEKGRFMIVEPFNGVIDAGLAAKLETYDAARFVTPSIQVQAIPDPKTPPAKEDKSKHSAAASVPPTNDALWTSLWGMQSIRAPAAWKTIHDSPALVAVIDTGIDYNHEDLKQNIWTNANNEHGYNFVDDNADPMDKNGHGTHCSGTIGAVGDNMIGVVGVNWHVKIMAARWLDANGSGDVANAIRAIDFAVDNGAQILSNSWYWPYDDPDLMNAIKRANDKGVLFVVAASNFHQNNDDISVEGRYPSSYPIENIIAVAAIDQNEQLATFSNYGQTTVHIAAPGVSIMSTVPNNHYDGTYSGTSMATPHVAGAAALLMGDPNFAGASVKKIKAAILDHSRKIPALNGRCVTGGVLDISFVP